MSRAELQTALNGKRPNGPLRGNVLLKSRVSLHHRGARSAANLFLQTDCNRTVPPA